MGIFDPKVTNDTTTGSSAPWSAQQPYLQHGFDQAKQLYDQGGPQYYQGQAYTPFAPQTNQALGMIQGRAMDGSPVNDAAQQQITGTLNGDFLNSNPYLDATYDQAAGQVRRSIDSQFAGGGRYSGGAHQEILGENLGDMATNLYGGNYQAERGRQMSMIPQANSIANNDYVDSSMLMNAGGVVQDQGDKVLNADMNRWNYNQNLPYTNLEQFNRNIAGNYGGETSQTQPMYSNSTANNLFGTALAGAGLLSNASSIKDGWDVLSGWF